MNLVDILQKNDSAPFLTANFMGVRLIGGYQFWSNPSMFGTRKSIPIILLNPTFLDILYLCQKYGGDALLKRNEQMHKQKRLPDFLYASNRQSILSCMGGLKIE